MSFTASERATLKTEIARRLSPRSWAEIDLVLEEFQAEVRKQWSGDAFSYVIAMLRNIYDDMLGQLAEHLNIETGKNSVIDVPSFWKDGQLRVFLSHISAHKILASNLQSALSKFGICAFVAHEDIEPTAEWQDEIERALRTCDALVALLNPEFNLSTWTDQEVGYGLGRGVPVFSVRLGISPYGLFGRKQAFNGNNKSSQEIARELFDAFRMHTKTMDKMADIVVDRFEASQSYSEAKDNMTLVEGLAVWKTGYKQRLLDAAKQNGQIRDSWGVPDRIQKLIEQREPEPSPEVSDEIPF